MGQRRRQLREELDRREKGIVNESPSSGLGAGGEARVAAAKLDELKKQGDALREQQSRARNAAWDSARAKAKKRRASSGSLGLGLSGDNDLEERTVRVKWSTKKESHSDHTLDVLFSRFGLVESVSIEEGTGNRALVTFASAPCADAAVAAYRDSETMRASFVGKRRPKRSAFAPRRQTMSPFPQRHTLDEGLGGGGEREHTTVNSFRDRESLVMMKLRQEAERQALIRKMAEDDGDSVSVKGDSGTGKGAGATATTAAGEKDVGRSSGDLRCAGSTVADDRETGAAAVFAEPASAGARRHGAGDMNDSVDARPNETEGETGAPAAATGGSVLSDTVVGGQGAGKPAFPVPSTPVRAVRETDDVEARRESGILSAMLNRGGASRSRLASNVGVGGSKSVPTTPVSARSAGGGGIDESDILARMMAMKR